MIYITGDIHGKTDRIIDFAERFNIEEKSVIILLGDVGANYYGDEKDHHTKTELSQVNATVLCIHGNHEMRPWEVKGYRKTMWNGGMVYVQDEFPNLLFAIDGEIYEIEGKRYIVIGGAYSIDKSWRNLHNYGWWESEQPNAEIKAFVEKQLKKNEIDIILSHTCPRKYEPIEAFLPIIDQTTVDTSTEDWLDVIEETVDYKAWYCGHWHIDKKIDKMHFIFESWEIVEKE